MPEIDINKMPEKLKELATAEEWAAAIALTRTAYQCRQAAIDAFAEEFTVRNKWHQRQIRYDKATPENLESAVRVVAPQMAIHETGGTEDAGARIPVGIRKAAGIPDKKVIPKTKRASQILKRKVYGNRPFIQRAKGIRGIFVRVTDSRRPIELLYNLEEQSTRYPKRPWFFDAVEKMYDRIIESEFAKATKEQWDRITK